ncbi:hypothetical protein [Aquamicrobium zhengzhouense]|uniref:Uncharacterized protein n=1 Tax=Aquamicrobium zhengzhouense TaxID=2781738 RepID=A0ABS0S9X2_9HYPH|nr:hypothetical protein [Aquamicrobium zhengzhouense]MBI1620074.1 hypothetical protein [Aquamicrobium zhengzhouense]
MKPNLYIGETETFKMCGQRFRVTIEQDSDMGAPWEEHEGHGPVSEDYTENKGPGGLILSENRGRGRTLIYDFAEACRIARRDGWGFLPGKLIIDRFAHSGRRKFRAYVQGGTSELTAYGKTPQEATTALYAMHRATFPSARAYAAAAARADFDRLRDWCRNEWTWCGVVVTAIDRDGEETGETASLWGIESDADSYLWEVAEELAAGMIAPQCRAA